MPFNFTFQFVPAIFISKSVLLAWAVLRVPTLNAKNAARHKAFINLGGIPIFGAIVIQFGLLVIFFGLIVDHISALRMAIIEEKYDE